MKKNLAIVGYGGQGAWHANWALKSDVVALAGIYDIAEKRVWNPKETKDIVSFVYSTGFIQPLKNRRPIFDLIKILFCYEPVLEG